MSIVGVRTSAIINVLLIAVLASVSSCTSASASRNMASPPSSRCTTFLFHSTAETAVKMSGRTISSMTKSPNESLRQSILDGAALKLKRKRSETVSKSAESIFIDSSSTNESSRVEMNCTYFIREACRSEINEITTTLMKSFHPHPQPIFDSYIRKYKLNHLQMCFDAIPKQDRGLFVACAVSDESEEEIIVGFCSLDGRPNDPSSRIEFLTESTLATSCPRPYLSDLGVLPSHRRKGIGQTLVLACEEWTQSRGYDKLYLKVDETNKGTMKLYKGMGYVKSVLPGVRGGGNTKWGSDVLLEKSLKGQDGKRRTWMNRIWRKDECGSLLESDGSRVGTKAPPI